jgi:hypothetical protein
MVSDGQHRYTRGVRASSGALPTTAVNAGSNLATAGKRRRLFQRPALVLAQPEIVQRIEDGRLAFITALVTGDNLIPQTMTTLWT